MDPYIGEIRLFAGNYAPREWAFCRGQLLNINQYAALYSIIGNVYGGVYPTTFQLPNLRGLALIHQGVGAGLTPRPFGSTGGVSTVTLFPSQMPNHTHLPNGDTGNTTTNPAAAIWGGGVGAGGSSRGTPVYGTTSSVTMNPQAISSVGGNQAHNNMQPYVAINYIISLGGIYPVKA